MSNEEVIGFAGGYAHARLPWEMAHVAYRDSCASFSVGPPRIDTNPKKIAVASIQAATHIRPDTGSSSRRCQDGTS